MTKRIKWIDGLKLFACLCVFFCHFCGVFLTEYNYQFYHIPNGFRLFFSSFRILTNGNFWVMVFCILSGYLARNKHILNVKSLFKNYLNRYFRFAIPFISITTIITIIYLTIGYHSKEFGVLFQSEILKSQYNGTISFVDILKSIFIFDAKMNNVMWTIRPIFYGNLVSYLLIYLSEKLKIKKAILLPVIIIMVLFSIIYKSTFIYSCACIIGTFFDEYVKLFSFIKNKVFLIFLSLITLTIFHFHNDIIGIFIKIIHLPLNSYIDYFYLNTCWNLMYAFLIVMYILKIIEYQRIFSGELLFKLSPLSFPIYLLHWPVIASFSLLFFKILIPHFSFSITFLLLLIITMFIILFVVFINNKVFGSVTSLTLLKISKFLKLR